MSPRAKAVRPLVVIGDAFLDVDLSGTAGRLAPDAPVPVLDRLDEVARPGGAALAAALAARSGVPVVLVAPVAGDADGLRLAALLDEAGVSLRPLACSGRTPVKRRVRADGQSLVRLDSGGVEPAPRGHGPVLEAALSRAGAVLVADYGRGTTALPAVREALAALVDRVPVVWDPHPNGTAPVAGVDLVTPNQAEAALLAERAGVTDVPLGGVAGGLAAVAAQAAGLVRAWGVGGVAVTLGPRGALLSHGESSPSVVPAPDVRAGDTCGAGDCFAATAAAALARGAVVLDAVDAAVRAAASFVADGAASAYVPSPRRGPDDGADGGLGVEGAEGADEDAAAVVARVRAAGGTVVATGGCFDLLHAGHVATLAAARGLGDCLVVLLNSDASVRRLKGEERPLVGQADRARVLAALEHVDAVVVFDEDTPEAALEALRPDVWAKGGDYAGAELPEAALLRSWGGQPVVLPYLSGRSTTGLVAAAASRRAAGRVG